MNQNDKLNQILDLITNLLKEPVSEEDNFTNEVQIAALQSEAVERHMRHLSINDLKRMIKDREDERDRITAYLNRNKKV